MHTRTIHADQAGPTRFHHNPDLAGDVIIVVPATAVEAVTADPDTVLVKVPGQNLEALVLEVLRDRLIDRLEAMPLNELRAYLFQR